MNPTTIRKIRARLPFLPPHLQLDRTRGIYDEILSAIVGNMPPDVSSLSLLLSSNRKSQVGEVLSQLGFDTKKLTSDEALNLLWYLMYTIGPLHTKLTKEEKGQLSGLTSTQLLDVVGPTYIGPTDKASLIYTCCSNRLAANYTLIPGRYEDVIAYPYPILRFILESYDYNDDFPPYIFLAQREPSPVELILSSVTPDNVLELADEYGIIIPKQANLLNYDLFVQEMAEFYGPIFDRPLNIPPPPPLNAGITLNELEPKLRLYTSKEINDAYGVDDPLVFRDRHSLYEQIIHHLRPRWHFMHSNCNNDREVPPVLHGRMNKDDPENPTLSYGNSYDYSCYQADELSASFIPSSDHPGFQRPDGNGYFPANSMQELRRLLKSLPSQYNLHGLPERIDDGWRQISDATLAMYRLRREIDGFSAEMQGALRLFFVWVFIFALYLRFWRGPGYGWTENIQTDDHSCSLATRDANAILNYELWEEVKQYFDEETLEWIEQLPIFLYRLDSSELFLGSDKLMSYLRKVGSGMECMNVADSVLVGSAYVYLHFLERLTDAEIVATVETYLPVLYELEEQLITPQIEALRDEIRLNPGVRELQDRLDYLEARLLTVTANVPPLPPFDPKLLRVHTDR